ncbi:SDR family NAD(P)-dependent oxidoreductase [Rhodococcus sp. NPDC127530]|uniref:SDR family NAD(P)-dependent oxidoreductase n=1 Tax=unclassified Rhodococcus (in: high G+C Gram-positive bacteria) TaxID=192944 RepID=UPI00363E7326
MTTVTRPLRLEGKRVLVTGAASGIGNAIADVAIQEGARVALVDYDRAGAEDAADKLGREAAVPIGADISDVNQVATAVNAAVDALGGLDALINVAGIQDRMEPVDTVTPELWDRVFAVNVRGTAFMIQHVLRHLVPQKHGAIVNTTSTASLLGGGGGAAYAASKGAIASLTRQIAWELAGTGVRINSIAPGATSTNLVGNSERVLGEGTSSARAKEVADRMVAEFETAVPLGRFAEPSEIARAAVFLASDEASYLHGAMLVADGGLSIH